MELKKEAENACFLVSRHSAVLVQERKKKARENSDTYIKVMMNSAKKPEKIDGVKKYVLGNWLAVRRTLHNKFVNSCSAQTEEGRIRIISDNQKVIISLKMIWQMIVTKGKMLEINQSLYLWNTSLRGVLLISNQQQLYATISTLKIEYRWLVFWTIFIGQ